MESGVITALPPCGEIDFELFDNVYMQQSNIPVPEFSGIAIIASEH